MIGSDAITINTSQRYQTVSGFGFALTDTSAYLINQVPNDTGQRDALLRQLFDPTSGIGTSWVRLIMGASDFTVTPRPWYSYRPTATDAFDVSRARVGAPSGDLSNIIPVLQQAISASHGPSPYSPIHIAPQPG